MRVTPRTVAAQTRIRLRRDRRSAGGRVVAGRPPGASSRSPGRAMGSMVASLAEARTVYDHAGGRDSLSDPNVSIEVDIDDRDTRPLAAGSRRKLWISAVVAAAVLAVLWAL